MTRYTLLFIALFCLLAISGCNHLKAKDRLNQGVMAYNRGEYQRAESLLKESMELEQNRATKVFYTTTLKTQFINSMDTPEKTILGEKTIQSYQELLKTETNAKEIDKMTAIIADLYQRMEKRAECREWLIKRAELPNQPDSLRAEIYYTASVLCWEESYQTTQRYWTIRNGSLFYIDSSNWENGDEARVKAVITAGLKFMDKSLTIEPKFASGHTFRSLLQREWNKLNVYPKLKVTTPGSDIKELENTQG